MTSINFSFDFDITLNASKLVTVLFSNTHMDVCIFTPQIMNEAGDPIEFKTTLNAVAFIVEHFPISQFNVGFRIEDMTNPYICITVQPALTNS